MWTKVHRAALTTGLGCFFRGFREGGRRLLAFERGRFEGDRRLAAELRRLVLVATDPPGPAWLDPSKGQGSQH